MIHEVRVYKPDGELKHVISEEEARKKFQSSYMEDKSFYNIQRDMRQQTCKRCGSLFKTNERRKIYCSPKCKEGV